MRAHGSDDIVLFARTNFRNERRTFGIRRADRRAHMYVIGKTGTGKSTLLETLIRQDIARGEGVALLDPHGDLAEKVLAGIPDERKRDVLYLDPIASQPLGFNPLENVPPLKRPLAAAGLLEVFKKIWADSWGPRLEHILRNALLALLDQPSATLADVLRLFADSAFRRNVASRIQNPHVRSFWLEEYEGYPARFRAEAVAPIQNKVGSFVANPILYRIVGRATSSFDLRKVMDEGKILVVNLAKGKIGDDAAALLGAMLVSKVSLAALSRAEVPERDRRDFYLYLDEFQNFTTLSLASMLSELRKYRVNMVLAHQYLAQLDLPIRSAILGNAGTIISFRVGMEDAEILAKEFYPEFAPVDLVSLPNYSIYLRLMVEGKRAWSTVKDKIVGDYMACYLKTIQHRGRPILIIDAFAGPGRFGDDSPGSPLIICQEIDKAPKSGIGVACLFADAHPAHRAALELNLSDYINKGISEKPVSDCSEALARALQVGKGSTLFFYLDPYGIKDLDFEMVKQIYGRDCNQSTEVLVNFNFKTFMRMSGNWAYNESAEEVARKVRESKIDKVNSVMGGNYWVNIITDPGLDKIAREDAVVCAYMERVRQFFKYTYAIPVKEQDEPGCFVPVDELAKYHLIFGTRSARAVVYMNDVANIALEPYLRQFKDGLLFPMLPERYEPSSVSDVKLSILKAVNRRPMTRPQICECVIPEYFLHYRSKEYRAILNDLVFQEKRLFPDTRTMKVKTKLNDYTLLSAKPWL